MDASTRNLGEGAKSSDTLHIARWLTRSSPNSDSHARATTRLSLIDFLGCSISASGTGDAKVVADRLCVPGEVPALGHPGKNLHPASAAYLHAWQAHAFEMDDGDWDTWGHLGSPTIAAALSAGWYADATVAELTDAVSMAFSFGMALGKAVNPGHYGRGFCTTGTIGTLTAAAASVRLLGLDEASAAYALDFAVAQAAGVRQFALDGSASCLIIPANAARAGLESATLAASGLLGGKEAIDGDLGFLRVLGGTAGLLPTIAMSDGNLDGIYFKSHSCCGNAIGPLHAFIQAWKDLGCPRLQQVHFELPKEVARNVNHPNPSIELERHLSLQLAVAMHLVHGGIEARDLIDLEISMEVSQLMGTVGISVLEPDHSHELDNGKIGFITLLTSDGRSVRQQVPALGPPLRDLEISRKFKALVEPSLGKIHADQLLSVLSDGSTPVRDILKIGQRQTEFNRLEIRL